MSLMSTIFYVKFEPNPTEMRKKHVLESSKKISREIKQTLTTALVIAYYLPTT